MHYSKESGKGSERYGALHENPKSYYQKEIERLKASLARESNYNAEMGAKRTGDAKPLGEGFDIENPARELTAFERANIRKSQQQRENELYSQYMKKPGGEEGEKSRSPPRDIARSGSEAELGKDKSSRRGDNYGDTFGKLDRKLESIEKDLDYFKKRADPTSLEEEQKLREKVKLLRNELERSFDRLQEEERTSGRPRTKANGKKKVSIRDAEHRREEEEPEEVEDEEEYEEEEEEEEEEEPLYKMKSRQIPQTINGLSSRWKGIPKKQREIELYREIENLRYFLRWRT